jgi:hypothetical protein
MVIGVGNAARGTAISGDQKKNSPRINDGG